MSDRLAVMADGRVEQVGTPEADLLRAGHDLRRRLPGLGQHLRRRGPGADGGRGVVQPRSRCAFSCVGERGPGPAQGRRPPGAGQPRRRPTSRRATATTRSAAPWSAWSISAPSTHVQVDLRRRSDAPVVRPEPHRAGVVAGTRAGSPVTVSFPPDAAAGACRRTRGPSRRPDPRMPTCGRPTCGRMSQRATA